MRGVCGCECKYCLHKVRCKGCSICEKFLCEKRCGSCNVICPDRTGGQNLIERRQTDLIGEPINVLLPALLPVLPDHLTEPLEVGSVVAAHGGNMFTSNGEHVARVYRNKGIHGAMNVSERVEMVLQWYVKDRTLEGFWDNRQTVYRELREFPLKAVICPNFSVYEDVPRLDHLFNLERSWIVYQELLEQGFPAIPDVTWYGKTDLDRWAERITKYEIPQIAYSFQTVSTGSKASNTWIHYLMGYLYLRERIPQSVDVILAGIAAPARLAKIREVTRGHRITALNQSAYLQSRRGILAEKPTEPAGELSLNQIFLRNLKYYTLEYKKVGLEEVMDHA